MDEGPESGRFDGWVELGREFMRRSQYVTIAAGAATVGLACSVFLWWRDPSGATAALLQLSVVLAALAWGTWLWNALGPRARLLRCYARWQDAMTWSGAVGALVDACRVARPFGKPACTAEDMERDLKGVESWLRERGVEPEEVVFDDIRDTVIAELKARRAELDAMAALKIKEREQHEAWRPSEDALKAAREKADAIVAEAQKTADKLVRDAHAKASRIVMNAHRSAHAIADDAAQDIGEDESVARPRTGVRVESLVYSEPGQVPSLPPEVERAAMRKIVADAERDAQEGRVYESHAAGVIIHEPARWSPYAAPFPVTQELLQLFDPVATGPLAAEDALEKKPSK